MTVIRTQGFSSSDKIKLVKKYLLKQVMDEIGMDMTTYEDKFFQVIEDLFKLSFNKPQISIIQAYIYEATRPDDWNGTVTIEVENKSVKTFDLKTPEQLWSVVQLLGKNQLYF